MKPVQAKWNLSMIVLAWLATAGAASAQPAPDIDALPTRSFQRIGTPKLRHGSRILCLAFSGDGQTLAAGGGNDPVRLWDPRTGKLLREFNEPWVHTVAFSGSGETMLYAGYQKIVRLYNFKIHKEIGRLEGHKSAVKALAVAPDTSVIASGSQDGAIIVWDWNTKRKLEELRGHTDEVNALVYSPDNNLLISAGSDRTILFWNTETNKIKLKVDGGCGVHALAISADGKTLFSAGDDYLIRRWDVETGKQTGVFKGHEGIIVSLFLRGDAVISGALDKTVRFWDAKTTAQKRSLPRAQGDCDALAVSPAGDLLAVAGLNNAIRVFEADTGKEILPAPGPQAGLVGLQLSPDNKRLASVTSAGQILVWEAATGKLLREWDTKQAGDLLLASSPDGKLLVTASDTVRFWNPETGDATAQLPIKSGNPVVSLAFSPNGQTIALGLRGSQIEVWDLPQKKLVNTFGYIGALHAIAWSPDGKKLAAGGGGKIVLWDLATNAMEKSFDVKEGPPPTFPLVASLTFGPDSRTLAAGCFDATIRVYNVYAKNPTSELTQQVCEGHLSMPYAVALSPDGRTLVTGSFDKTVRLWEAFSGKQIAQFKGHVGAVMGVAFAADGRSVYSAGADTIIYQWDVPGLASHGKLPEITLSAQELEDAWKVLASEETPRGHQTMWRCIASAKQAIADVVKQNKIHVEDPERVKKLFRDLDSIHYGTRMAAMSELLGKGRWMEGRYAEAMANPPSLEYKRRVETLKEKLATNTALSLAQERLRMRRFMLICEQTGGADAITALQRIADRGPEEELREEAKGSLRRLNTRK